MDTDPGSVDLQFRITHPDPGRQLITDSLDPKHWFEEYYGRIWEKFEPTFLESYF